MGEYGSHGKAAMAGSVARVLSMGLVLGVANLSSMALAPLSVAQAAYPSWSGYQLQVKRPQFRPWHRTEGPSVARLRPHAETGHDRSTIMAAGRRLRATTGSRPRHSASMGGGYSAPRMIGMSTQGQQLGVRFRPDDRFGREGSPGTVSDIAAEAYRSELAYQFRPANNRRKPAYEQWQAATPAPWQPYAGQVAPHRLGWYWPAW